MLEIKELQVAIEEKTILQGLNLTVKPGEIHAIMGPNGAGKSTLARVLAGDPAYEVLSGDILLDGTSILGLDPEERSHLGLFMGFQHPIEIPGVSNKQFLQSIYTAKCRSQGKEEPSEEAFLNVLHEKMQLMQVKSSFLDRQLNTGFSGGEKKRNEILQMALLEPKLAVLDETDSGLDIDAMKIIANGVNRWMDGQKGLIVITHYQRLLDYIKPDFVHVVMDGKVVQTGGAELALELEKKGYEHATIGG